MEKDRRSEAQQDEEVARVLGGMFAGVLIGFVVAGWVGVAVGAFVGVAFVGVVQSIAG